jgi:hypothetical protein
VSFTSTSPLASGLDSVLSSFGSINILLFYNAA